MKRLTWIAAGLCLATPLAAQERPEQQTQERVHEVRPGDTLWDIARTYLNDPFLWPEIFRLNTDVVQNPARIFPSSRLRIPGRGVMLAEGAEPGRTIFFPRDQLGDDRPVHTIRAPGTEDVPILAPGDFYRAGFLARDRDVRSVGHIAERIFPSVVPLEMPPHVQLYDRVFVPIVAGARVELGDRLHFFRPARTVRQYGRLFLPTGIGTVAAVDGNVATVVVIQLFDAITVGDLALPLPEFPVPLGVVPVPEDGLQTSVIAFQAETAVRMTEDIAFLSTGGTAGVSEGDEFVVYIPPQRRRWGTTPAVDVARLQVVRVDERTAAARVVTMNYPALEPGLLARRVARMP